MIKRLETKLFRLISCRTVGNNDPPNKWESAYFQGWNGHRVPWRPEWGDDEINVISFGDDAGMIQLGTPTHWWVIYHRPIFAAMVRWYVWRWVWGEWFGLRRKLWLWLLHRWYSRSLPAAPEGMGKETR